MFNSVKYISILIVLLWMQMAVAQSPADLIVWQPLANGPRYVLPHLPGLTPQQLAQKYQEAIRTSSVYGKMENAQHLDLSTDPSTFSRLPTSTAAQPNVMVVLNRPNQMTTKSPYLPTVIKSFEAEGSNLFAVPVGLEVILKPEQMSNFRKQLNTFDGQLGVGGDDPHPNTFKESDLSKTLGDISVERDASQMGYIDEYLKNGKGRVFYVCGSMQRAAILDGHGFHCDIGHLTKTPQRGPDGPVMLEISADAESEVAMAAGSTKFQTSNYHHAGVNPSGRPGGEKLPSSKITSYNIEGDGTRGVIPKSIEFPGNAGFATQFHPEFRGSPEEVNIVKYVSQGWKMRGRYTPQEIVNCLNRQLDQMLKTVSP